MTYTIQSKETDLINVLNNLNEDHKITIIGINDFGFPQVSQTKFHSIEIKENYSQRFVYLIHKPKHKRKHYKKSLDSKDIIILNDWHDISTESQHKTTYKDDHIIKKSIYTSFDTTFLKEIDLIYNTEKLYSHIAAN
ncbi:hypothetical protein CIL05_07015 [Virgibacillus profundi]|uniref:Uncharacterized protein n=1 Tax=Virgibacillus profundi TaxID=2024555 RepID=A0A2A2IGE9_9BACI|nr:hypothetical protein [Virgibacillus profundi]PAV30210.1 hypothetical protein CIL05_07015 [Virgibacillus profundi]PXY54382.1 hypothetical protein CIT14_07100 [Virgibacillus profundi]